LKRKRTILYLGRKGFPVGMAETQRQLQISKAIQNEIDDVLVISRKGCYSQSTIEKEKINTSGSYEGIKYVYTSGTPLYPSNFIVRNFLKIWGAIGEFVLILFYGLTRKITCVVSTSSLPLLKYYWALTRVLNVKLVYDYVEYISSLEDRSIKMGADRKKNFDTLFFDYADSFIVISSYLEKHLMRMTSKPYLIVPPIIDFEKFLRIDLKPNDSNYFLFCGSTHYFDVVEFIIDAYRKSDNNKHGVGLVLIVNGSSKKISKLQKLIEKDEKIKVLSNLSYEMLIGYYKNARALLIPLQNNLQDQARFPFKISEYTAASRPIVTSDSGAIIDYFQDGVNALLAKTGDVNNFSTKLNFVLNNPTEAERIAANGHALGKKFFNYKSYSSLLSEFLSAQ
jgi:glycosyltransferase involved in cell wall biosynthesis